MSAIWGFISFEDDIEKLNNRKNFCKEAMEKPYKEAAIDRFERVNFDKGFFSCGIQYFTPEAEREKLPIKDEKRGIIFTGDIVLNARQKLADEILSAFGEEGIRAFAEEIFGADSEFSDRPLIEWPDGAISYMAYVKWDKQFVDHIEGLFAIAVYDEKKESFRLFTDHMGCRCIYYSICGRELFFSSLCRSITNVMPKEYFGICEKWIAGCEYSDTPAMLLYPGLSPFENIYQLVRGHMMQADLSSCEITETLKEYYNPAKNKAQRIELNIPSNDGDRYCRMLFRKVFWECVEDAVRSSKKVACTVSSGLDSTSVAAVAASILSKKNEKLYSFTSVPLKEYKNTTYGPEYITDESEGVKKFCRLYDNIVPTYLRCEGKSAFTEMDRLIEQFEVPGKALVNQVWFMDAVERMKEEGCNIALDGQFGNFALSFGGAFIRTYHELWKGNVREAKKQLAAFGKRYSVPRKVLFNYLCSYTFTRLLFAIDLDPAYNNSFDQYYLKKELFKKYKVKRSERKVYKNHGYTDCEPRSKQNNAMVDALVLGTVGMYDTKTSIYYGILSRDPTRDKRLIDLCISLPEYCFCEDGLERRLVRAYLDDMVPGFIRNDPGHRGVQSPDALLRLQMYGTERRNIVFTDKLFRYMNVEHVRELFSKETEEENYRDIVRVLSLDKFLKEFDRE